LTRAVQTSALGDEWTVDAAKARSQLKVTFRNPRDTVRARAGTGTLRPCLLCRAVARGQVVDTAFSLLEAAPAGADSRRQEPPDDVVG
jgi:hypothetical protein